MKEVTKNLQVTAEDGYRLARLLEEEGIVGVVAMFSGDPSTGLKIIEQKSDRIRRPRRANKPVEPQDKDRDA